MNDPHWRQHGLLDNGFQIFSPAKGAHRSGNDAIFLAATVNQQTVGPVADFGAGTGAAGFSVAHRCPQAHIHLVEIDKPSCQAIRSAVLLPTNKHLQSRLKVHNCDLTNKTELAKCLSDDAGKFATIIVNPPFNEPGHRISPNADKARAHVMHENGLADWIKAAQTHLKSTGNLHWITRPTGLPALLNQLQGSFGAIRIRPIHSGVNDPAQRILIQATKASRAPLLLLPGFIVHNGDGTFTEEADNVLRGRCGIGMDD